MTKKILINSMIIAVTAGAASAKVSSDPKITTTPTIAASKTTTKVSSTENASGNLVKSDSEVGVVDESTNGVSNSALVGSGSIGGKGHSASPISSSATTTEVTSNETANRNIVTGGSKVIVEDESRNSVENNTASIGLDLG